MFEGEEELFSFIEDSLPVPFNELQKRERPGDDDCCWLLLLLFGCLAVTGAEEEGLLSFPFLRWNQPHLEGCEVFFAKKVKLATSLIFKLSWYEACYNSLKKLFLNLNLIPISN